jgi:hypothetical protein
VGLVGATSLGLAQTFLRRRRLGLPRRGSQPLPRQRARTGVR